MPPNAAATKMTHDLWTTLNSKILEYLSGVTLADLVASQVEGKKLVMGNRPCPMQPVIEAVPA